MVDGGAKGVWGTSVIVPRKIIINEQTTKIKEQKPLGIYFVFRIRRKNSHSWGRWS